MAAFLAADEVFLTSTGRDVQPVHQVDDRRLPVPGPLTASRRQRLPRPSSPPPTTPDPDVCGRSRPHGERQRSTDLVESGHDDRSRGRSWSGSSRRTRSGGGSPGQTGDWSPWADQFTEDAVYVEHLYGRFEGREAIRGWITSTMTQYPNDQFTRRSRWSGPRCSTRRRGWIVCEIQNRLNDLGDGDVYQAANITKLHYAGDGMWSYEEDAYNPEAMAKVVAGLAGQEARAESGV